MLKLAIISHALAQESSQARWKLLAERYPVEVSLLVPKLWKSRWLRDEQVFEPKAIHNGRFRVIPLPTTSKTNWGRYFFLSLDAKLRSIRPDVIYVIHAEMIWIHQQVLTYRKLWSPHSKIIFFTMNALGIPQNRWYHRFLWNRLKNGAEAALCHYPGCEKSLRDAGFNKPIFLQTQIGVDETVFRPSPRERKEIRRMLGVENKFVIGYAGRLTAKKGVLDLLSALPLPKVDWALLLVGNGELREQIQKTAHENGWQDRVILTGTVPMNDVAKYMRAMDCFVLGSRTTPHWIDTFPLVTVQAMACGIPVIGSNSGAIPWQLRNTGLIFSEGDVRKLQEYMVRLAKDPELCQKLRHSGRTRSLENFSISAITKDFYNILQQVRSGKYNREWPDKDPRKGHPWKKL